MNPALSFRAPTNLWQKYCHQLVQRPVLSRSLTGVVGAALGDAMAQAVDRQSRPVSARAETLGEQRVRSGAANAPAEYDWMRTARLALYSGIIASPLGYKWYHMLDKLILPASPKSAAAVLLKTLCDQVLFAPMSTAMYLGAIRCLEGRAGEAVTTIQQQMRPCLAANYILWPAAHLVNFAFVPASQRILYVNVIAVFWGAFMSKMVNKVPAAHAEPMLHAA